MRASTAVVENVRLDTDGDEPALALSFDSVLEATNLRVEAGTAVRATGSRLDFAGSLLIGRQNVAVGDNTVLVFSLSRVESPLGTGFMHGMA